MHLGGVRRRFEAIFGGVFWEVFWDEPINLELKRGRVVKNQDFLYFSSDSVTQEVHRHSGSTRTSPLRFYPSPEEFQDCVSAAFS